MPQEKRFAALLLALMCAAYLVAVFPLLFFRHDDWWILGNSVRYLPEDWGFLWKPMLYFGERPLVWFFRPGFKGLVYVFFNVFGFTYALWMATLLALYVATLWMGNAIVVRITGSTRSGFWFIAAMAGSWLIHFGSLAWMGEGMMNVPQAFLLMLSTYAFVRAAKKNAWCVLSVAAFVLALGFKESSLFQPVFFAAMVCAEPSFRRVSWKKRIGLLAPFAVLGGVYLLVRLGYMPVSPSYRPEYTVVKIARSAAFALGPVMLPFALWGLYLRARGRAVFREYIGELSARLFYVPFVLVSISVYLGHDFFSPGWFLVVGTFTVLALACTQVPAKISNGSMLRFAGVLFLLSVGPIAYRLQCVGWWQWHRAQLEVFNAIAEAPADTTRVFVRPCENPDYPGVVFGRVVANEEAVRQIWYLTHGRPVQVQFLYCDSKTPSVHGQWLLDWKFPESAKITSLPLDDKS
jgi:hypothetical protein